jgi:hypothetical protein
MQNKTLSEKYKKYINDKKKKKIAIDSDSVDRIAKILCPSTDEIEEELYLIKRRR